MRTNVILEPKTRIGKRRLEADGNEFTVLDGFKKIMVGKSFLITIASISNGERMLIDVEGDKDFNVRFQ